ncbi:glycogen synthase GlgA [Aquibacillus koreensis]|uniref:Glycogen synthase n=1 Tax=Aquibacillus koreensis TaxID=279446 RepID=A0A9X3WQS4_9BACI|nr:glycogen synthase GlgA [Aquibacillus koreensis]MCT2534179.1 glycogen synthase GlgA [Aquibacillus koreensis]MDC3422571.1 glycogen synthase GlgA [Aquibacillus koreensis]
MEKNVLFVASECSPFVKTGGLADVVGSLPQVLQQEENTDVRVILPLYEEVISKWQDKLEWVSSVYVPVGWRNQEANIYQYTHQGIIYYFIGNDYYFSRKGVYGYYDDGERFVFFSRAVIESLAVLDFKPDILHGHDWQAGLAVAFAKILQPIENMKTVFTIHNIKYQGILPLDTFDELFNIPREHIGGMEWNGLLNCMKSGIFHADKITTVSPTYADEIKTPYYGEGLYSILTERQDDLVGIINGIDLDEFNPMKDPHLTSNYKYSRVKKKENKESLQQKLGLPVNPDIPLYVIITRLVEQKGLHLVQTILDEFLQEDVQFVVLGTGDYEFENFFYHAGQRNPDKLVSYLGFDEALARQLYAASDFFVMPSQFEPCGLSQLIALQYKSVPIVRETGGLKDTVFPYNELTGEGNGFSFSDYNAHDLLHVLRYSLEIYHNEEHYKTLLKNVNKSNFSWNDSAKAYAELYNTLGYVIS